MKPLSDRLTARRKQLGLTVEDVQRALLETGHDVAYSTVAGWFNGSRGVRKMQHLKALCGILQTDLNSLTGDDVELVQDAMGVTIARELAELEAPQRELVLALVRSLKKGGSNGQL